MAFRSTILITITTHEPELLFLKGKTSPSKNGWQIWFWSDEFIIRGKPDTTNGGYDYRFIANQEKAILKR